jgi:hypothetical protein
MGIYIQLYIYTNCGEDIPTKNKFLGQPPRSRQFPKCNGGQVAFKK